MSRFVWRATVSTEAAAAAVGCRWKLEFIACSTAALVRSGQALPAATAVVVGPVDLGRYSQITEGQPDGRSS